MQKLLPIVPGCMALVIGLPEKNMHLTPLSNTVVEVVMADVRIGYWIIDSPLARMVKKRSYVSCKESRLIRIDGGDFKHEKDSYELPRELVK